MSTCVYTDGEKDYKLKDIIRKFYENTSQLKNSEIYSSEEIQKSTVDAILKIKDINNFDLNESEVVTDFIVKENPIFNAIPGLHGKTRLAPEYILENRIKQYVIDHIDTLSDSISGGNPSPEMMNKIMTVLGEGYPSNKVGFLIEQIEKIIEIEDKTKDFGTLLHELISLKIKGNNREYYSKLNNFINLEKNSEVIGLYSKEEWIDKINNIVESIKKQIIKNHGTPISEIFIVYNNEKTINIKGKIDLVTVDTDGNASIFEIKISKTNYDKWDSAKLITLDYQLALYKQLLGQHINVDKLNMYTIPIQMSALGNPNLVTLSTFRNRGVESSNGLIKGKIDTIVNTLIPLKIIREYDPTKIEALESKLHQLLPNFKIQTGLENDTEEDILKKAIERQKRDGGNFKMYNEYEVIEGLPKGIIEAETIEKLKELIQPYLAYTQTLKNKNLIKLKSALQTAISNKSAIKTSKFEIKRDMIANNLLKEYLNDDWEVIDNIIESEAFGLIILRNKTTGNINIISLSGNQLHAKSNIQDMMYGDIEYMKTFLFINEFKDILFPYGDVNKLGEIIIFNPDPKSGQSYYRNNYKKYDEFVKLMINQKFKESDIKLKENNIISIENTAMYNLDATYRYYKGADKDVITEIFQPILDTDLNEMDYEKLLEIQRAFYDKYPTYREKSLDPKMSFDDDREVLLAMLQVAIISKGQVAMTGDFQHLSEFSLNASDFRSVIRSLYSDSNHNYDKEGQKITGIFQGLKWTTPDWVQSQDLRNINKIMSTSNQHIGEKMSKASERIGLRTNKYYDDIGYSDLSRSWIGETQSKYKNLWLHKNNEFSDEFKTKNPYIQDAENALLPNEAAYLKNILFEINIYKLNLSDTVVSKLDPNKLESLMSNDKIKESLESGEYFAMPLVRREEITRFGGSVKANSMQEFWQNDVKAYLQEVNDFIDPRELEKDSLSMYKLHKLGFYEMFDVYARQSQDYKSRVLEKNRANYFEWNLDTIAHRIAFNKIRVNEFNKQLPKINAYLWWIKLMAGKQGVDISKQLDYVAKQMDLAVFDEPIIDEEFKDMATTVAAVKKFSTAAMLAFRPALMVKELVIGVIKGTTLAATQIYGKDQFTVGDLTKAYTKLMTIDNKFSNDFNLIDRINAYYRFANMDVNSLAKKTQTDRHGVFRGLGRYMYMCNTIPDYYNRLSLFLAKMIHDGSYEAHTLVNGIFKYDVTKDKRFEYYLQNRDKHKDDQGRFIPAKSDLKYNTQRQHYLVLQEQLRAEYDLNDKDFTEADLIDKAYSETERSSFKSFTDMSYGYYDKDTQSQSNNTWWGVTFMQFMQFWPGKMKMWFGKPTNDVNPSPLGKMEQDKSKDGTLLWRKTILNEDGSYDVEPTEENTGDPMMKWTETPFEGLAYSVFSTVRDGFKLDFKAIKDDKERLGRVAFALNDAVLTLLLLGLLKALFDAYIAENGTDGLGGQTIAFMNTVNKKVLNEHNVWQSTLGSLSTDPAWMSWGNKLYGDLGSVITGNKTILDAASRNFGALEMFKEEK